MVKHIFMGGLWIAGLLISVTLGGQLVTIAVANSKGSK